MRALSLFVLASYAAGWAGLLAAGSWGGWLDALVKPPWMPDDRALGMTFSILFALMGMAAWLVWVEAGPHGARGAHALFGVQLGLNAVWMPVFFGLQAPLWSLAVVAALLVAAIATLVAFARISPFAAAVWTPVVAWVGFATVLNFRVWQLNP